MTMMAKQVFAYKAFIDTLLKPQRAAILNVLQSVS